jgi:hypothetical protein
MSVETAAIQVVPSNQDSNILVDTIFGKVDELEAEDDQVPASKNVEETKNLEHKEDESDDDEKDQESNSDAGLEGELEDAEEDEEDHEEELASENEEEDEEEESHEKDHESENAAEKSDSENEEDDSLVTNAVEEEAGIKRKVPSNFDIRLENALKKCKTSFRSRIKPYRNPCN